ncbi:MAG: hypothetical protein ABII22_04080 [Candidatus Micrarchaeota archaeon]
MDDKGYIPRQHKKDTGHASIPPTKEKKSPWMAIAIICAIAVMSIAIAFLIIPNGSKNGNGVENVTIIINERDTTYFCDEVCKLQNAIAQSDVEECSRLNDTNKEICYKALSGKVLEACALVSEYEVKKSCIYKLAKEGSSIEPCNNLENGDRRECILSIDPCFYGEAEPKNTCMALDKKDYRYCEGNEDCIFEYISKYKSSEACDEMEDASKVGACKSIVEDKDVCKEITTVSKRDYCYQMYATKTNENYLCGKISAPGNQFAYDCYYYFAVNDNNPKICANIDIDENRRWNCYANYALETNNIEGCNLIDQTYAQISRNNCYFDVAKKYTKPEICENLASVPHKIQCYEATIIRQDVKEVSDCDGVAADDWRNQCYTSVARTQKDPSICNKIETFAERDMCVYYTKQSQEG